MTFAEFRLTLGKVSLLTVSVKLRLRDGRTNGQTERDFCPSVRFACQGRPSYGGGTKRDIS